MYVSNMRIRNWRNFTDIDANLGETVYLIGANASGKSNLMDVFRFMRDIAQLKGGGLQQAVDSRGGLKGIRSLAASEQSGITLAFEMREGAGDPAEPPEWRYELRVNDEAGALRRPAVLGESVWRKGVQLLSRPDRDDEADPERLLQTHLEQINMNREYRSLSGFFSDIRSQHLVPQILKYGDRLVFRHMPSEQFGQGFLDEIDGTPEAERRSRLLMIEEILAKVVPDLERLRFVRDGATGGPHLEIVCGHWRAGAGGQREDRFSDGTLRLIAMLWTLLSSAGMILLEEPELSLHNAVVEQIPDLLYTCRRLRKEPGGQILVSTHSEALLSNESIEGVFLMLKPGGTGEGTQVSGPSSADVEAMRAGLPPSHVLLPQTGAKVRRI